MRRVLLLAALALGLAACASTTGLGAPSERSALAQQTGWRPHTSVPVKPLPAPPRKPVLTGGFAMKPITQ